MTEALRLTAYSKRIPKRAIGEISETITPEYLRGQLQARHIPNLRETGSSSGIYEMTEEYRKVPTRDLTLKRFGSDFDAFSTDYGTILGAIALTGIRKILRKNGISSHIFFSNLNSRQMKILSKYNLDRLVMGN